MNKNIFLVILIIFSIFISGCYSENSFKTCYRECQRIKVVDEGFCVEHDGDTYGKAMCKDGENYGKLCYNECRGIK